MQGQYQYRKKCILKIRNFLLYRMVWYGMGVLSCAVDVVSPNVFIPLFRQFLETEMTWSQPIIVRECIFKNQNLCFASR